MQSTLAVLGLVLLAVGVAARFRDQAMEAVAWPDEAIYLVGARNVVERGTLNTNYYLTYSLLRRGYPHRDVHMPGYVLALAPAVAALGPTLEAAVALNVLLFAGSAALVYVVARGILPEHGQAVVAAALFTVLPPFPGYLFVAYPEIVVAFVFLAGIAALVHARGPWGAALAGVLFAAGALFRETLLLAAPLYLVRLPPRLRWRAFAPAAAATLALVVVPFARDRAVHPNALYPSVVEEALRTDRPLVALAKAVTGNVLANLRATAADGAGLAGRGRDARGHRAAGGRGRDRRAAAAPRRPPPGPGGAGVARPAHGRRAGPLRGARARRGLGRRPGLHGVDAAAPRVRDAAALRAPLAAPSPRP